MSPRMIFELIAPRTLPNIIHTRWTGRRILGMTRAVTANTMLSVRAPRPGPARRNATGSIPITKKPTARMNPNDRSSFRDGMRYTLVKNKFFPPIVVCLKRFLVGLVNEVVSENQQIHLGAHETSVCVFRTAHDGLTAHIE